MTLFEDIQFNHSLFGQLEIGREAANGSLQF